MNTQGVIARAVRGPQDFWRIRDLLLRTVSTAPLGLNWDVRRWESKYFYDPGGAWSPNWAARIRLCETAACLLAGVVHPEGTGDAHLQVAPDFRHLEPEMIAWAEAHLAAPAPESGSHALEIYVHEYDVLRQRVLAERGYTETTYGGVLRHMPLDQRPIPDQPVPAGYTLRTTCPDDLADCQRIADLLNAAIRRDFDNATEYHVSTQLAPCYRRELELGAEAPDGTFAAYAGVPYDALNRRGIFEPVCTHPDHRRKGLARALMLEGLHRLRAIGACDVIVDTGDMIPANRLYESMGFTEACRGYAWLRTCLD